MRERARVARILVASLRTGEDRAAALARGGDVPGLADAARFHGVVPWVHEAIADEPEVDERLVEELATARHTALRSHLAALAVLDEAATVLDGAGIPWMVVKGPVLAHTIYPRPDLRDYGDLDLVVPRTELGAALDGFERRGHSILVDDWDRLRALGAGQVPVRIRHSVADVHWHLVNWSRVRDAFAIDMDALFARRRTVDVAGRPVPTLDAVDTMLHLTLHAATSGGMRLIWLKDIQLAAATGELDWDQLTRRADEMGLRLAAAVMLRRSRRVLGANVPEGVERALTRGESWPAVVALAERLAPPASSRGGRSVLHLTTRTTRADSRASVRELGSATGVSVRKVMRPRRAGVEDEWSGRDGAAGGERRAFLQQLAL